MLKKLLHLHHYLLHKQISGVDNQIALSITEGATRRFYIETDFDTSKEPVHIYGSSSVTTPLMTFYTATSPRVGFGTTEPEGTLHLSKPATVADQTKYPKETNIVINNTSNGSGSTGTFYSAAFRFDHGAAEDPGALVTSKRMYNWVADRSATFEIWNASGNTLFKRIDIQPEGDTTILGKTIIDITDPSSPAGNPTNVLETYGGEIQINNGATIYSDLANAALPRLQLSGGPTTLAQIGVTNPELAGIAMGYRGENEPTYDGYGKQGDGYLYSSVAANGLNIISQQGTGKEDYVRFYVGYSNGADPGNIPDIHIQGSGATRGNVGIYTDSPTEKLHVEGSVRIVDGTEQNGYVLTSDVNGVASWQPSSGSSSTFTGNTSGTCITDLWVSNIHSCSPLVINPDDEGNVYIGSTSGFTYDVDNERLGIGTTSPTTEVEIQGSIKIVDGNEEAGFVLTSDADGVGSWEESLWEATATGDKAIIDTKGGHTIVGTSDFAMIAGGESNTITNSNRSGIFEGYLSEIKDFATHAIGSNIIGSTSRTNYI